MGFTRRSDPRAEHVWWSREEIQAMDAKFQAAMLSAGYQHYTASVAPMQHLPQRLIGQPWHPRVSCMANIGGDSE